MEHTYFFAVDLGATSGRTILGCLGDGKLELKEVTRFPNHIIEACGHCYWDIYALYREIINGLKTIAKDNIPIRSIGIEVMPAYYEDYLQKQYPGDYISPLAAFRQIDQTTDFPAMAKLLHEVKVYRGDGIAAGLFYEAKVAEAVSLVVEEQKKILSRKEKRLSEQDVAQLKNVIAYLNDHYAFDIPLERLAKIACMGTTKLKTSFKQLQGCTITEYIQQRRMSQAEHLLIDTDFTMGQIAEMIGYSTSSRFAELFRKSTGLLPIEYRKMAQQK